MPKWLLRSLVGLMSTIILSQTGLLVKIWLNDLHSIEEQIVEVTEMISNMARNQNTLNNKLALEGLEDLSAWDYQLQVNNALMVRLEIEVSLRPRPPRHLRERE